MRITATIAATALTLTTPAPPESELEALLDDITATRTTSLDALEDARGDDEVREILTEWRKDLIDADDTVADLREDAGELTEGEEAEFDEAADAIKAERAGVRKLRAELLLDDDTVVVPTAAEELAGLYGTTFFDALERSEDGDVRIVYGIPGADTEDGDDATGTAKTTRTLAPNTKATTSTEPTPAAASNLRLRAERMQDTDETTTPSESESETETTSSETSTSSSSSTASSTESSPSSTESTTSSSTTSSSSTAPSILQNRTTSATSTTSKSTTSSQSSTSRTTTTSNERDDDLADTGTPMRGLIGLGALALLAGVAFLLPGSRAARR